MSLISKRYLLSRTKMLFFLNELIKFEDPGSASLYIFPRSTVSEIEDLLAKIEKKPFPDELIQVITKSKSGTVLFWSKERKYLILPPLPLRESKYYDGYVTQPLQKLIEMDWRIGLILVHLGTYAIGICQGENILSSKVGTGLIHGRHKKGGSSQQRFQRRRQKQVQEFLDRVCTHIQRQFEPQMKQLDYIVYGGPYQTILQLQKRCSFLKSLSDHVFLMMDVPALRQNVLEATIHRIWFSSIIECHEDQFNEVHLTGVAVDR
ncbi:Vms1/Ankzf1 family peptidyl-tRNA hydrolase [Chloroflexota bacterium]